MSFSKPEVQVLDYKTQQYALLPLLATSYAFWFTAMETIKQYFQVQVEISEGNLSNAQEVGMVVVVGLGGGYLQQTFLFVALFLSMTRPFLSWGVTHLTPPPCHDQTEKLDTLGNCDSVVVTMTRAPNYSHHLLHHLYVWYLSIIFDVFVIALALWMYDHAFTVQKLMLYFELTEPPPSPYQKCLIYLWCKASYYQSCSPCSPSFCTAARDQRWYEGFYDSGRCIGS